MATRNVVLSRHQHELVESLVSSGRYQNASEVLRAGLRLLERQETEEAVKLAALREAAEKGWADLASGRYDDLTDEDLDDFIGQLGVRAARVQSAEYRLTHAARADIISILTWSGEQFGAEARQRYEALIATAIRDAASLLDDTGHVSRPELGEGMFSWHLSRSRARSSGGQARRPRHFLICRLDGDVLVIGRVLHDAMDLPRHVDPQNRWE